VFKNSIKYQQKPVTISEKVIISQDSSQCYFF
jgi:hypothetical protein